MVFVVNIAFTVQTKGALRGHVYKNTTWENAKTGDKVVEIETDEHSKEIDPYWCAIKYLLVPLEN